MSDDNKKQPVDKPAFDDDERTVLFQPMPTLVAPQAPQAATGQEPEAEPDMLEAPTVHAPPAPPAKVPPSMDDDSDRTILIASTASRRAPKPSPASQPDPQTPLASAPSGHEESTVIADTAHELEPITHTNTASVIPPVPGTPPTPLNNLDIGTVINNMYRVVERLDQGGMGRVFRGVEIGTGENVAIKVILPEMAEDEKVAKMFRREARTLRQLHHDAIVRYFAYVPPDQNLNLHALVMGFIQGTKLSDALNDKGALSRDQVIKLTTRIADGLEGAHKVGVVHRDLSPDNVMLEDGDLGKPILIDFGISRSSTVKDVTIGNEFAGKLKWVSPEQLGAFGGEAEAPSDVYSLGLLMVAMLTGKPLQMGSSIVEAVQMRQSVPDLSYLRSEFQDLLNKMLQPDPAKRLPGMWAVSEELQALDGSTSLSNSRLRRTLPPVEKVIDRVVPGLQAVPFAASSGGTDTPHSDTRALQVPENKSGLQVLLRVVSIAACAAIIGTAVFFKDNLLPSSDEATAGPDAQEPVAEGIKRVVGSRATFLAESVPQDCAYAVRRTHGESAGLIEGFAQDLTPLQNLGTDFGAQFGSAPDMIPRQISPIHCSLLELAHTFQGTRGAGVELSLEANTNSRADGVIGTLHGSMGRQNWLALVDPKGQVFSLMRQFDAPIGSERRFSFRLPSAAPGIYMLVATASDSTLVRAGALKDGTLAQVFLPLLGRELATDGQGAIDITFLELTR